MLLQYKRFNMLREYRRKAGLTQEELAEKAACSLRMIRGYEQGDKDINKASAETIFNLMRILDCDFIDLLNM